MSAAGVDIASMFLIVSSGQSSQIVAELHRWRNSSAERNLLKCTHLICLSVKTQQEKHNSRYFKQKEFNVGSWLQGWTNLEINHDRKLVPPLSWLVTRWRQRDSSPGFGGTGKKLELWWKFEQIWRFHRSPCLSQREILTYTQTLDFPFLLHSVHLTGRIRSQLTTRAWDTYSYLPTTFHPTSHPLYRAQWPQGIDGPEDNWSRIILGHNGKSNVNKIVILIAKLSYVLVITVCQTQ